MTCHQPAHPGHEAPTVHPEGKASGRAGDQPLQSSPGQSCRPSLGLNELLGSRAVGGGSRWGCSGPSRPIGPDTEPRGGPCLLPSGERWSFGDAPPCHGDPCCPMGDGHGGQRLPGSRGSAPIRCPSPQGCLQRDLNQTHWFKLYLTQDTGAPPQTTGGTKMWGYLVGTSYVCVVPGGWWVLRRNPEGRGV